MNIYNQEKYGFVYIWYDRKHKRYYIGCHWGTENDGYICSSPWMKQAYRHRPKDFKRKILTTNILSRKETYEKEQQWLNLIKESEISPNNSNPKYYNFNIKNNEIWHKYEENIKIVGEKISAANKGKVFGSRPPEVGEKISKAKKENFAKKEAELGYKFDSEHITKMSDSKRNANYKHTDEWKQENSERMKRQWSDGTRKRAEPKQTMTPEEQALLASERLKSKWSDPEWKERQKKALSEGAKSRPPKSELSKQKASLAQKGKPKEANAKTYQIEFLDDTIITIKGLNAYAKQTGISKSSLSKAANNRQTLFQYNIKSIKRI